MSLSVSVNAEELDAFVRVLRLLDEADLQVNGTVGVSAAGTMTVEYDDVNAANCITDLTVIE